MTATVLSRIRANERITLGLYALFGIAFLALTLPVALDPLTFWTGIFLGDYAYETHELHHFVLGGLFTVLLLGVIVQAVRPTRRVGALHAVVLIWVAVMVTFTVGGEFSPIQLLLFAFLLGMVLVHPLGREQLPRMDDLDRRMAAVAAVIAVGATVGAGIELYTDLYGVDDPIAVNHSEHVAFGHYLSTAAAYLTIGALAVYASLRGVGWRYPAYSAAGLLGLLGAASIAYPGEEQSSSLGVPLGAVALVLAVVFLAVAEFGGQDDRSGRY